MKKTFTTLLLLLLVAGFDQGLRAQCAPDSTIPNTTNYPKTWAEGCVGQPYNQVVHFSFPRDTTVVINVTFISFEVVAANLPAGLTYTCNISDCKWTPSNTPISSNNIFGCITISGTPTSPFSGQASIEIEGCGQTFVGVQCQTDVQSFNIDIVPSASPNFTEVINGATVNFTDQTTSPNLIQIYRWDFGDGGTSLAKNPTHTFTSPGTYNVCLETQDNCGLQTFCKNVTITAVGRPEPTEVSNLQVSPNPAGDKITIRADLLAGGEIAIRLLDLRGMLLLEDQAFANGNSLERSLDVSQIAPGTYLLEVQTRSGRSVKRIQIL